MNVNRFLWDDNNEQHILLHDVFPDEAEEVFISKHHVRKTRQDRYLVYGTTLSGRYLFVVVVRKPDKALRVITARDMTDSEKKFFRKVRRK